MSPLAADRFFFDSLTMSGEIFMIPAERRDEWQTFDTASEETHEILPIPEWARPIEILSHMELEAPVDIYSDQSDDAAKVVVEGRTRFSVDWWNA